MKYSEKIIKRIRESYLNRRFNVDDDGEEGQWFTSKDGHHIHVNEEGVPDKGNPYVLKNIKGQKFTYAKGSDSDVIRHEHPSKKSKNNPVHMSLDPEEGEQKKWKSNQVEPSFSNRDFEIMENAKKAVADKWSNRYSKNRSNLNQISAVNPESIYGSAEKEALSNGYDYPGNVMKKNAVVHGSIPDDVKSEMEKNKETLKFRDGQVHMSADGRALKVERTSYDRAIGDVVYDAHDRNGNEYLLDGKGNILASARAGESQQGSLENNWESMRPRDRRKYAEEAKTLEGSSQDSVGKKEGNPRLSDVKKTWSGVDYPKTKDGVPYTKALEVAEQTALNDEMSGAIPKGTWDKVVKNLKPSDIVYQKNEDGETIASIPGLATKVDSAIKGSDRMKGIYSSAVKDGTQITSDMLGASANAGMYMDGLENSVKGASHIEDKAERKLETYKKKYNNPDATVDDVAADFGDLVRYTAVTNNDNIVSGVNEMCKGLEDNGYTIAEIDNKFLNKDGTVNENATYRAVHITAMSPSGRFVEVQVHSKESLAVKDKNHVEYEEQRSFDKTPKEEWSDETKARNEELNQIQIQRWKSGYTNPKGIEDLKSFNDTPKLKSQMKKSG